jgi:hypothetical protein
VNPDLSALRCQSVGFRVLTVGFFRIPVRTRLTALHKLFWIPRTGGRKRVSKEVRALIFQMVAENPTWRAPRIHGELLKLGFDLSPGDAA